MLRLSSLAKLGAAVLLTTSLSGCQDLLEQLFPQPNPTPTYPDLGLDISFYALSGGTQLDAYSTKTPVARTASVAITGLQNGEKLLALDFRPATGQLYGLGSTSRLYVINQKTGTARAIGNGAFTPALAGNLVGFDFNPTVDRIRLVTNTGQNLRLNPETGTVAAEDAALTSVEGATVTGAAYTNNVAGASTTVLYDLDPATDQLYRQDPPNEGKLVALGSMKLNISGDGGFDIDAQTGTALGLYPVNGKPTLFTVDLNTGAARALAQYSASLGYTALAIPTQPVAYAAGYSELNFRETTNFLHIFDPTSSATPSVQVTKVIGGLAKNEKVLGLDFRPATGQLYALVAGQAGLYRGDDITYIASSRLYTINPATGAATRVAELGTPVDFYGQYGFDFNPVVDRIRIVSSSGQNLRVNPEDGSVVEDGRIQPSDVRLTEAAYSNSLAGATSTSLYALGDERNGSTLYQLSSPNTGILTRINFLDINSLPPVSIESGIPRNAFGFNIGGTSNTAYAIHLYQGLTEYSVSTVNLSTGTATYIRPLNLVGGRPSYINALAIGPGF
ncbi:DUF4394 domain-containing protein [Hymenobacter sp. BT491]|uniref:DUF4394 domain-containing protein n=1 Tax=Hymenobacter sp. BT491 TaxID=2766779 RepID=UPI00165396AF|nr:DUF4394 domain-containing protein [Hymenobacter sp. BT491]MBC6989718.1 DUF4394 domain-containing protein [Hymenobacter sp. BT491]